MAKETSTQRTLPQLWEFMSICIKKPDIPSKNTLLLEKTKLLILHSKYIFLTGMGQILVLSFRLQWYASKQMSK